MHDFFSFHSFLPLTLRLKRTLSSTFIKEMNQSISASGYENDSSKEQTTAINGNFQMFAYSFSGFASDNFTKPLFQGDSIPAESYSDNDDSGHKNP